MRTPPCTFEILRTFRISEKEPYGIGNLPVWRSVAPSECDQKRGTFRIRILPDWRNGAPGALEKQDPYRLTITDPSRLGPFCVDEMGSLPETFKN